ncbi:MAG: cytochrome c biogenesis protein CcsA [Bdellovibrionaceae bacterium]|nr:cytochrome c biogenesis protein CcsA [Pseudobdellovibrionaceae bacterium]
MLRPFFLLSVLLLTSFANAIGPGEGLRYLPVQDGGRVKPYSTFAQETLEVVYGKKTFEKKAAWEVVLTWMLAPSAWAERELFEVRNKDILDALGLDSSRRWFKGDEIFAKERFPELMQDLRVKRESKEKLTPYFQALQRIENQWFVFREMASGRLLRVFPPKEGETWLSVAELPEGPVQTAFLDVTEKFVSYLAKQADPNADATEAGLALNQSVASFEKLQQAENPQLIIPSSRIAMEIHYLDFHPFRLAYVSYLLASILLLLSWAFGRKGLMPASWFFVIVGFLLHTYGFGLRVYLAGRPPVANMYETVVWVAWGAILFAAILEYLNRTKFILLAGALGAWACLVMADSAPAVLDPSLQPLEAVLRSNYWLIVHVMTITISYAAFFLAFVLGDIGLFYYLKDPTKNRQQIKSIVSAIYRSMQIGVAFLAPGIILGGVWADYSWGRFWGWDPKETWALIALLGYLAVLHARLTNWMKDLGMIVAAVVTFSLVIMAWYGVNFVLGAGLHSYGFGAGGVEYVATFIGVHLLFTLYIVVLQRGRERASGKSA